MSAEPTGWPARWKSVRVPATVETVLAARIDRLPTEEKRLLQTAAVIGKDVPFILLQAIAEVSDDELHAALSISRRPSCSTR